MGLMRVMTLVFVAIAAHGREECNGMQCPGDEEAALLQLGPLPSRNKWINGVSTCLNASAKALATKLTGVSLWGSEQDEGFAGNFISDGHNDMWDQGNLVSIAVSGKGFSVALPYTQQCDGTWTPSGHGDVEYFTCRVDVDGTSNVEQGGSTVWFAGFRSKTPSIEGLLISGELGADGDGNATSGRVSTPVLGRQGLYSQTVATGDPSINHLVITEGKGWVGTYATGFPISGDSDYEAGLITEADTYMGKPTSTLLYVLWGGGEDRDALKYSPADFQAAFDSVTAKC